MKGIPKVYVKYNKNSNRIQLVEDYIYKTFITKDIRLNIKLIWGNNQPSDLIPCINLYRQHIGIEESYPNSSLTNKSEIYFRNILVQDLIFHELYPDKSYNNELTKCIKDITREAKFHIELLIKGVYKKVSLNKIIELINKEPYSYEYLVFKDLLKKNNQLVFLSLRELDTNYNFRD